MIRFGPAFRAEVPRDLPARARRFQVVVDDPAAVVAHLLN